MPLEDEIKKQKAKNRILKNKGKPQRVYNLVKDYNDNDGKPKGQPTCVCKRCKKEFEQDYVPDRNAYTDWKTCGPCRKLLAEEKSKSVLKNEKEVSVAKLPYTPYNWQIEAAKAFEEHRFIVLSCGNRCLLPGAFVNGCDKFVEDVTEDDYVIGKNGKPQKIIDTDVEDYVGDIYTIKAVGIEQIKCNDKHPIMIAYGKKPNRDAKAEILKEEFITAEDLETRFQKLDKYERLYVKMPRIKGHIKCNYWDFYRFEKQYPNPINGIPLNEETAWMIGLYCAEGCYLGGPGCKWTLNYNEPELAEKLCSILNNLGLHYNIRERKDEGTRCVVVTKSQFNVKIDEECGHGALNKKIPKSILYNEDDNILYSFLKGYYAGDGYFNNNLAVLSATTVSHTLAQQLQTAWTRLGFYAKVTSQQRNRKKKDGSLYSREYLVKINDCDGIKKLGYNVRKKSSRETAIITDECIYAKLESVTHEYGETEIIVVSTEDETFVANNINNHNTGKDRFSIMTGIKYFVECLNENRAINNPNMVPPVMWWIIAPIEPLARQIWRELRAYFPKEWIVACSNASYQMETIGGGVIEVRSGYNEDMLVGVGLDLVTITEAARFKDLEFAWANLEGRLNSAGRGRIKDRGGKPNGKGKAIINSSPLPGKNGFYHLYMYGQKSSPTYSSDWWSCQYPWTANPDNAISAREIKHTRYGDITYEEVLIRQLGERLYKLNYLGQFDVAEGAVFKNFEERCVINPYDQEATGIKTSKERKEYIENWRRAIPGEVYIAGYDPATGSSSDSPILTIRHKATGRVVRVYDMYGKNYEAQYDLIESVCKMFNYAELHWLRTGHTAIEGVFTKRGLVEVPIDEQGQNKGKLVQTLELAVENGDVHVLMDGSREIQTLILQMNDYTEKSGKYSNNEQPHDDYVSSLYAAFSDYVAYECPVGYCGLIGGI